MLTIALLQVNKNSYLKTESVHQGWNMLLQTSCQWSFKDRSPPGLCAQPLLLTMFSHDCTPKHLDNSTVKHADDTTIITGFTNNDKSWYRNEIYYLADCCPENNLLLSVSQTKQLIVDFRKKGPYLHQWSWGGVKGGTHITIIGLILLQFYPFLTTEDYLLSYKVNLYDYPVVCGVLRVNLSW